MGYDFFLNSIHSLPLLCSCTIVCKDKIQTFTTIISPIFCIQVLTALRFFAAGSYQMDVGENQHSAVSQPTVSRIIEEVVNALCEQSIIDQYIHFPRNFEELNATRQE